MTPILAVWRDAFGSISERRTIIPGGFTLVGIFVSLTTQLCAGKKRFLVSNFCLKLLIRVACN